MKFLITTEKGSTLELDTEKVEGVTVEIDGKKFSVDIKQLEN